MKGTLLQKTYYSCLVQRSFVSVAWMQDSLQKLTLQPFSNFTSGMAGMRKCLTNIKWLLTRMQNKEQGFEKRSDRIPITVACVCYIIHLLTGHSGSANNPVSEFILSDVGKWGEVTNSLHLQGNKYCEKKKNLWCNTKSLLVLNYCPKFKYAYGISNDCGRQSAIRLQLSE